MNKYEIELNLNEQRMALMSLGESVSASIKSTLRKRTMRASEKVMSLSSLNIKLTALLMAVDRIDAILKAQGGQATPEGHYPEALGNQ